MVGGLYRSVHSSLGSPIHITPHNVTYMVHLVEADEGLEEADVGPRQPVPQQVALPAQHGLGVICVFVCFAVVFVVVGVWGRRVTFSISVLSPHVPSP